MEIGFRIDQGGHLVTEGCEPSSPLAMLLETDITPGVEDVERLRNTVWALRPPLSPEYFAAEPLDFFFTRTHLRFEGRVATVRFIASGEHGRMDRIDLRDLADTLHKLRRFRVAQRLKSLCLSRPRIRLWIQEEYGFRNWVAELTGDEYRELIRRWDTMSGLSCTVPVDRIVPQAVAVQAPPASYDATAHIHECGDSHLDGSTCDIPDSADGLFWIDGMAEQTLSLYSDYPDLLLSRDFSPGEIEGALTEILPGLKAAGGASVERLFTGDAAALVSPNGGDQEWPCRLTILYLPEDHGLGDDPLRTIGTLLQSGLDVKVAIELPLEPGEVVPDGHL